MGIGARTSAGPSVIIIGCGLGGIAAAVNLQRSGVQSFTILEQSAGPGGTWWDNRYPGCEVDIASHAYSFSFFPYDWKRTHATMRELQHYTEDVIDAFGLRARIRFSARVRSVDWTEAEGGYIVTLENGETLCARAVISAVGMLNNPRYPEWPGLEAFRGPRFHTARWEEHDLTDKRVAVIGTGSTATQLVPALAAQAKEVVLFQREPGWVLPKNERDFTEAEMRRYRKGFRQKLHRMQLFKQATKLVEAFEVGTKEEERLRTWALKYIERTIEDPELRTAVTPSYPYGCKRPVLATTFYSSLNRPNVTLVPRAVAAADEQGVIDVDGLHHDVDLIVFATGFQTTNYLGTYDVRGTDGRTLKEWWGDRPRAFLGITVPSFPNFFILYGPNTNGGWSIISQLERQAEVAAWAIAKLHRRGVFAIDTRPKALDRWLRWVDRQIAVHASSNGAGCHNYYYSASGDNVTQWPLTNGRYYFVTRATRRLGLRTVSSRGRLGLGVTPQAATAPQ